MRNPLRLRSLAMRTVCVTCTMLLLSVLLIGVSYARETFAQELLQQRITLKADEQSVKAVLTKIEKLTSVKFLYSPSLIKSERKVNLNAVNEPLSKVLETLLSPLQVSYEVAGKQVILKQEPLPQPVEKKASVNPEPFAIEQPITGTITDAKGEVLAGVSVLVKGTNRGTSTNGEGKYSLVVQPSETLVFSFVGYIKKEIVVGNQTEINLVLNEDTQTLGEVVVTALGIKRDKRALGYSIQEINGESLAQAKEANVATSLAGKIAGVQVTRAGNGAGGSSRVVIRGANSLVGNSQPLYVIDGIPMDNSNVNSPYLDVSKR